MEGVTLSLMDYELMKTALQEAQEVLESVEGLLCDGCSPSERCKTCGILSKQHSARNVIAKIKSIFEV